MNILEYTLGLPPYRRGGLPRYSTDLSEELAEDNNVYLMYPGQMNPFSKRIVLKVQKTKYKFQTIEMQNPLPVSLGLGIKDEAHYFEKRDITDLKIFIDQINPKIVHFHTLMGIPLEFLEYLHNQKIKVVYTTHDFYGLCPKMLSDNPKEALKSTKCTFDCMMCNLGPSYQKVCLMQSHLYKNLKDNSLVKRLRKKSKTEILANTNNQVILNNQQANLRYKLRKYYMNMFNLIDIFHFNSSVSQDYFHRFLPNAKGKVIPITHSNLIDNRKNTIGDYQLNRPIRLGYVGPYDNKKGFFLYTQVLRHLNSNYEFRADFYGDILNQPIFKNNNFVNHGIMSGDKLTQEYRNLDILIVPSLWHETFGFVVLEALLQGTPCLVSKNVGAKDLVPDGWIFKDKIDLQEKIVNLLNDKSIPLEMHRQIITLNLSYQMNKHAKEIIEKIYY